MAETVRAIVPAAPVLVTGANGFVGRAVCTRLLENGWPVTAAVRNVDRQVVKGATPLAVGPIEAADWARILPGHQAVVHVAGCAHQKGSAADTSELHRRINFEATARLATMAAEAGIPRMIFTSTIKVSGERTVDRPFDGRRGAAPTDPYGWSKWKAEEAIRQTEALTGLSVAIVRPPLVYGPGVRANFLGLMRLVDHGIPLPFASIRNRRSLIYVDNLADLIVRCVDHPAAGGRTFTACDGVDFSTPDLVRAIAQALGKRARLFAVPPKALRFAATLLGRRAVVDRLLESLQVDSSAAIELLDWQPRLTPTEGLRATVCWYRAADRDVSRSRAA